MAPFLNKMCSSFPSTCSFASGTRLLSRGNQSKPSKPSKQSKKSKKSKHRASREQAERASAEQDLSYSLPHTSTHTQQQLLIPLVIFYVSTQTPCKCVMLPADIPRKS